ncbi:PIH1 domain-containing protein 2 [Pholidichthys leucotaenia]
MSSRDTKDVLQHVDQFFSMLDDLFESDPEAYRRFIEKTMKEGAESGSPPELHSCIRTDMLEPNTGLLYINICSWKSVPAPQGPSRPLPVCAGKLETGTDEGQGCYSVLDIALNPAVLRENRENKTELNRVYVVALNFAQRSHGMRLSQQYSVVNCSPRSSRDELHHRLGFQKWPKVSKHSNTVSQTPADLLPQISSLESEKQFEDSLGQIVCRPAENIEKNLIQVISTTSAEPQTPHYHIEVKTDRVGVSHSVELTVELPLVRCMSECQLSVSEDDALLDVEDVYHLLVEFPKAVNEDTASAIFNKTKRRLTLKVDVL